MPYKIKKMGGKYCVCNQAKPGGPAGSPVPGGCHPDQASAEKHMRALYANVKDAKGAAVTTIEEMTFQLSALRKEQVPSLEDMTAALEKMEPVAITPELVATPQPTVVININGQSVDPAAMANQVLHVQDAPAPEASKFTPIRLYFQEGEKTPDGRVIDPNAINFNRKPPYSIRLQTVQPESGGHAGAVVCGVITKIARDGLTIVADGFLDLTQAAGQQAVELATNRTMQTWSPDLGDAVVDAEINVSDEDPNEATGQSVLNHIVEATFLGATLVSMPALASAVFELLDESGNVTVPAPDRAGLTAEPAHVTTDPADQKQVIDRKDAQTRFADTVASLTACVATSSPPVDFFSNPNLTDLQRWVTITPEGRVFGHAAGKDECHIGFLDRCVTIDMIADCAGRGNFEYAMPGYVVCADGSKVATGPLPIKGGHAAKGLRWKEALSHYDDPSSVVADICYGMDDFGVWFSGAIRPTATPEDIHVLRASGVSLDAREINGDLRYLATCAVNTPGFAKASARILAASAETEDLRVLALVGGNPVPSVDDDCGCEEEPVQSA